MRNDVKESSPIVITGVRPQVEGGRFPIQRSVGDTVVVEADIFTSRDEELVAELLHRRDAAKEWTHAPMQPIGDDRWRGEFAVSELGDYQYTVTAGHAGAAASAHDQVLDVRVDAARAGSGAWYLLFPRSCAAEPGRHGTFRDVQALLPYIAGMGFDVLLLPPIHPIGQTNRRGDAGSPWAVGSTECGHDAVHPELGTLADFGDLLVAARKQGLDIALDIALQCSPDHPWVRQHPEWFHEHPSLLYPDILPFRFEAPGLRQALKGIFDFWFDQGVRLFSVDSPQDKPFPFWGWLLPELKRQHADVVLLARSITRPKVMRHLAKLGFDQSLTHFTWHNTKAELESEFAALTANADWFRPSLWPSTPDILPGYLQRGGVAAFEARLVLAATLSASYGIYGPAYELQERAAEFPGSEEYQHSEKYNVRHWQREQPDSLYDFIARLNRIRRDNPALRANGTLRFHATDNEQLICYSRQTADNVLVTAVNLDPHQPRAGWLELTADAFGLPAGPVAVHDLISDARFTWQGSRHFVALDPLVCPAQVFRLSPP